MKRQELKRDLCRTLCLIGPAACPGDCARIQDLIDGAEYMYRRLNADKTKKNGTKIKPNN